VRDDLATPQALGILWESLKSEDLRSEEKWGLIAAADELLGLSLETAPLPEAPVPHGELPEELQTLVDERETARKTGDYAKADRLREAITVRGYRVEDGPKGPVLTRRAG
jgi:cysteinyl-tRNA synthetase